MDFHYMEQEHHQKGGFTIKMKKAILQTLIIILFTGIIVTNAGAVEFRLSDWGFNIDGTTYCYSGSCDKDVLDNGLIGGMGDIPGVDSSGFDVTTGLGTIVINVTGPGHHTIVSFFDHDIDLSLNGFTNETASVSGAPLTGQSWEIDEPGYKKGDIFEHLKTSTPATGSLLDYAIGKSTHGDTTFPDDVSMAMGWDFTVPAGSYGMVTLDLSTVTPSGAFYLVHNDPDSKASIYLSSQVHTVPEPGTLVLFSSGLVGLVVLMRRQS